MAKTLDGILIGNQIQAEVFPEKLGCRHRRHLWNRSRRFDLGQLGLGGRVMLEPIGFLRSRIPSLLVNFNESVPVAKSDQLGHFLDHDISRLRRRLDHCLSIRPHPSFPKNTASIAPGVFTIIHLREKWGS